MKATQSIYAALAGAVLAACGGGVQPADQLGSTPSDIVASGSTYIYGDALVAPWGDWSWATHTLSNPSPVYAGSASIKVTYSAWTGLYFGRTAVAAGNFSSLVLSVNGGATSGAALQVRARLGDGTATTGVPLGKYCDGGTIPAGQWVNCRVPVSGFAPAGSTIVGIAIQEWAGKALPAMYFDELALEPPVTAVAVGVSPSTASVTTGGTAQFTASVSGSTNTAVTWSVSEGSPGGAVSSTGLYTAPSAAGTYHVVATSQADATKSATATVTVTAPVSSPPPSTGKESWVWVYMDFANQLNAIASNKASFTHVSPTFYTVNYAYQSGVAYYSNCANMSNCTSPGANNFSGLTTRQFADRVKAMGLVTHPIIFGGAANSGVDTGILNILDNVGGAGDNFIAAMTAEAVANGYDGYNIDWETNRASVGAAYADKFVAFVNKFKAALAPYGMALSVDAIVSNLAGTWCSGNNGFIDLAKLGASSVDRVIIEDYTGTFGKATTSCQNVVLSTSSPASCDYSFTGLLNMMCPQNLPMAKAVIGVDANQYQTNPIAGPALDTMRSYGFTKVAVWPQYPFMSTAGISPAGATWYGLLQNFLTH